MEIALTTSSLFRDWLPVSTATQQSMVPVE